jgi:hypothetical protein
MEKDRKGLGTRRIAENLEILHAETRMLRIVVTGLVADASPSARAYAIELIKQAAAQEPRFAVDFKSDELARVGITRLAADWIANLTPASPGTSPSHDPFPGE